MTIENGCEFPDDLLYYVERSQMTWVRVEADQIRIGLTDPAQTRAGKILHVRVKAAGTAREKGKPVATIESGKWAGPVMAPIAGEVTESNADVEGDPGLLNTDPYGRGWIVRMRPSDPAELASLLRGDAALAKFREILQRDNIRCLRCQG